MQKFYGCWVGLVQIETSPNQFNQSPLLRLLSGVSKFPGILEKEKVIYKHQIGASVVKYYLRQEKEKEKKYLCTCVYVVVPRQSQRVWRKHREQTH